MNDLRTPISLVTVTVPAATVQALLGQALGYLDNAIAFIRRDSTPLPLHHGELEEARDVLTADPCLADLFDATDKVRDWLIVAPTDRSKATHRLAVGAAAQAYSLMARAEIALIDAE
jgi:hypothetical protein